MQLWQKMWVSRIPEIVMLMLGLFVLTGIFFFQNWFARRPVLLERVRIGFLLFTLFGIGWYAKAQLSVVNLLSVFNAGTNGFDWGFFLMEPLIFILWGAVLISLLFWGRGPFCGWLCPFGALQELMNKLAKALKNSSGSGSLGIARATLGPQVHYFPGVTWLLYALAGTGRALG